MNWLCWPQRWGTRQLLVYHHVPYISISIFYILYIIYIYIYLYIYYIYLYLYSIYIYMVPPRRPTFQANLVVLIYSVFLHILDSKT